MAKVVAQDVHPRFLKDNQLNRDSTADLAIRHGIEDTKAEWADCFARDLETDLMDEIYPYLWLVGRKAGVHIDPLHKQIVKRRVILANEDPNLHLVWYYGTIYIKPLPDYLLNHMIWMTYIPEHMSEPAQTRPRYNACRAASGFLRTYSCLIQHESDFIIAQKANLVPKYVSFQRFQKFIRPFRSVLDGNVSHRYQYGQFRLTRLNWAVRALRIVSLICPVHIKRRFPWNYHEEHWQTSQYIQHYAGPLFFTFALLTLILSSMQVVLAALGNNTWETFVRVSWGFAIATIVFAATPAALTLIGVFVLFVVQGQYALRTKREDMQSQNDIEHQND